MAAMEWYNMATNMVVIGVYGKSGKMQITHENGIEKTATILALFDLFGAIWHFWHHLAPFGPAWPQLALIGHFSIFISRYFKVPIHQGDIDA